MRAFANCVAAGLAVLALPGMALADCGIAKGSIRVLTNDFPALQAMVAKAEECTSATVTLTKNQTKDNESIQIAALKANPAEYTSSVIANSSLLPLLNDGLVRPLDGYVAKFGQSIKKTQLITIDGKVMAVAFMANAQHLFYRDDILQKAGVAVPKSYEDMLAAAKVIKDKGLMDHPIGGTYKAGWNLGEEFVNMYIGEGGEFFKPGSAEPAIDNAKGVAALNMLKSLSAYMNPDYLTFDSNALQAEFQAGKVAMATFWGSRAGAVLDPKASSADLVSHIKFASAPTVGGGHIPATTLWWDGFTISKNITDDDAEATFRALVHGISPEMANANGDKAVWLTEGFTPGPTAGGVLATFAAGAKPYPMQPYMDIMHTALGGGVADFLQGKKSAEKTLADIEASYATAAKQAGFLK